MVEARDEREIGPLALVGSFLVPGALGLGGPQISCSDWKAEPCEHQYWYLGT